MFLVLRSESKTAFQIPTVTIIQTTHENAKKLLMEASLKRGKMGPNKTDEGTFFVENNNILEEHKNTLIVTAGYVYGETREIKSEMVALHTIYEVPLIVKEMYDAELFTEYYKNEKFEDEEKDDMIKPEPKSAYTEKMQQEAYNSLVAKYETFYNLKTMVMTVPEGASQVEHLNVLDTQRVNALLKWCEAHNQNCDVINLMGYLHQFKLGNSVKALECFFLAAEKGSLLAKHNLGVLGLPAIISPEHAQKIVSGALSKAPTPGTSGGLVGV